MQHLETDADFRARILAVAPRDQHVMINLAGPHKLDAIGRMHFLERKGGERALDLKAAIANYKEASARLARFRKAHYDTPAKRALHIAVHELAVCRALDRLDRAQLAHFEFCNTFAAAFVDAMKSPIVPGTGFQWSNYRVGYAIACALAEIRT